MFKKTRHTMSNSIGLVDFLRSNAKDPNLVAPAIELIDVFPEKYAGGYYNPIDETQIGQAEYFEALNAALRGKVKKSVPIQYVGLSDLRENFDEQLRLYQMVKRRTLKHVLPCAELRQSIGEAFNGLDHHVKLALGTYKLRTILDRTLGHGFSKIVKNNIVAIWRNYFAAVMLGDVEAASRFGALSSYLTQTMPIGLIGDGDMQTCVSFVEHTDPKRHVASPTPPKILD